MDFLTFFSDGTCLEEFPIDGHDKIDIAMQRANFMRMCWGSYRPTGANAGFTTIGPNSSSSTVNTRTFQLTGDGRLVYDKVTHARMRSCDGLRMNGAYRREDWQSLYCTVRSFIRSLRNSQFVEECVSSATALDPFDAEGRHSKNDLRGGSGVYVIRQYTLTLIRSDGRGKNLSFHIEPGVSEAEPPSSTFITIASQNSDSQHAGISRRHRRRVRLAGAPALAAAIAPHATAEPAAEPPAAS